SLHRLSSTMRIPRPISELLAGTPTCRRMLVQEVPGAISWVVYDTPFYPCSQGVLLSASTVSGRHSTVFESNALSSSCLRKRHTRRLVPESAKAFTLPWRLPFSRHGGNSCRHRYIPYQLQSGVDPFTVIGLARSTLGSCVDVSSAKQLICDANRSRFLILQLESKMRDR